MVRSIVGFVLALISGILSIISSIAFIISAILIRSLYRYVAVGAEEGVGFMGMGAGTITQLVTSIVPFIVAGIIALVFGIMLIISGVWMKKDKTCKKGAIISLIFGILGLFALSIILWRSSGMIGGLIYVLAIMAGILGLRSKK